MVSKLLLAMSNVAEFCMSFSFNNMVLCVTPSSILIMASPDVSSINGAFTLINFCSLSFNTVHSFVKMGKDLFKTLKQQSHEFKTPSSSSIILIPNTKSTFL